MPLTTFLKIGLAGAFCAVCFKMVSDHSKSVFQEFLISALCAICVAGAGVGVISHGNEGIKLLAEKKVPEQNAGQNQLQLPGELPAPDQGQGRGGQQAQLDGGPQGRQQAQLRIAPPPPPGRGAHNTKTKNRDNRQSYARPFGQQARIDSFSDKRTPSNVSR